MTDSYLTRHTLLKELKENPSERSWEEFHSYYKKFIYSIIIKMGINESDCDDLSQKVLLKIWKSLPNFDYNQKKGSFRNWLYTITKNTVLSFVSANKKLVKKQEDFKAFSDKQETAEIAKIINNEWERHIAERAFNTIKKKISPQALDAFQSFMRDEPVSVTAKRLNLEENTVYVYRLRTKEKLLTEIRHLRDLLE